MRLALLILFLLLPNAAHAEPVTTAVAIFAAWAGTTAAVVYTVAAIGLSAGVAIYGSAQARKAQRQARDATNAALKDRMVNKIGTEAPHRYIYGRAKVGANIVAMFTTGSKDQYRHLVCVHANHECDAIEEVYVNNVPVGIRSAEGDPTTGRYARDSDSTTEEEYKTGPNFILQYTPITSTLFVYKGSGATLEPVTITSVSGKSITVAYTGPVTVAYDRLAGRRFSDLGPVDPPAKSPMVRVQAHLGGASDGVDGYLHSLIPALWPTTSVLRGMCYTVITLDLNHPEFQGGQVPIHALIRGKKLYDPRTTTTYWSANPALAIYDYLTSPLCDVDAADLPVAEFITAANVCDEVIDGAARYTINGDVSSDQSQASVLGKMAECMAGGLVSTTWSIYAGKYVAPVMALSQADIVGNVQMTPGASDADIYNGVKGQYVSSETKYVLTDFKPYQNAAYRAADARDLYTDIDFPFTDSLQRVTNLCRIFTEDQRNGFTMRAEFSLKAWPLKVGQRVTFTSELFGQVAKIYRITDKAFAPNSAVQLTLKEDAAEIWDFADAVVVDATPNTELPDPWEILPLASISITSGDATLLRQPDGSTVPRMLVLWPLAPSVTVQENGQIEIEWRAIGSTVWSTTTVPGDVTEAYLSPVTPGWAYVVRARCANPYMGTQSNWVSAQYQVTVFEAQPVVYTWSATQPAAPDGTGSYTWSTEAYAAPTGWSLTKPTAPSGGNETLWEARALVTDIADSGSTQFQWPLAAVAAIGYAPSAAGMGPAGYSNARVFAYQRAATAPTGTPGAVNYDFTTATITTGTLANGWLKTIPAADGNPLYVTSASASAAGTTDSIASNEWSGAVVLAYDGGAGTPGLNNATVTLYQRSASATAPAKPSATCTYTFATGALTGLNNGWTSYIPSTGGAYLHTTFATAISATAMDTIATGEWATVQLMYDAAALIAAQAAADAANAAIANIASDNVLSAGEKPEVVIKWDTIVAEQPALTAQADNLGVSRTAYKAAYDALFAYLHPIPYTTYSSDTTIVGSIFRAKFTDYYTAKQALLNGIAAKSAALGNQGISDAAAAQAAADSAANEAAAANARLANIASDNVLSAGEKPEVAVKWDIIATEQPAITAQADTLGVSRTAYKAAYDALATYLGPIPFTTYTTDTEIVGSTFRGKFTDYYTEKQALLNAIAAKTATTSTWAGTTGAGKPADNATVGAPAGTNVGSTPAEIVEERANGAIATPVGFGLSITNGGTVVDNNTGIRTQSKTLGATVTSPPGSVTYAWAISDANGTGGQFSISGATTANATITCKGSSNSFVVQVTCTISSNGLSRVASTTITFNYGGF